MSTLLLIRVSQVRDLHGLPFKKGEETIILAMRNSFRKEFPALFMTVPGDEEEIGGCLSAGRGFVYIGVEGDVEPCPFAPYLDSR